MTTLPQNRGKMRQGKSWRDKSGTWLDFVAQRGIERMNISTLLKRPL